MVYGYMMSSHMLEKSLAAVVFDSAPGKMDSAMLGFTFIRESQRYFWGTVVALLVFPLLLVGAAVAKCINFQSRYLDACLKGTWDGLPILFLYSETDVLIPYATVEGMIAQQEEAGARVSRRRWKSSPHVQHLRTDPAGYREVVKEFLETANLI